jgi:membrane fusion protein, multidrug efflux system
MNTPRRVCMATFMLPGLAMVLGSCEREAENVTPIARPVRTITTAKSETGVPVTLTGRVAAEDEVALAFRISGRLLENHGKLADRVQAGQLVARLESQNELNSLRAAQATLAAAQGQFTQAQNQFDRQDTLLKQGWTTRANHDQAKQALQTARSQVEAAEAQLKAAHDLVSFTELKADAPGVLTAIGPAAGEVVQAGQMIVRVARKDGRDAVFDVPAQLIHSAPSDPQITVSLADNPSVTARGRVREVAPQADPVTRTFEVRVGLTDPPPTMRLGATVNGRVEIESLPLIEIPATALTKFDSQPAVWIVDPASQTVSIRNVEVVRFDQAQVAVAQGLSTGEVVVTAGVQALHPGQRVRLLGSGP